MKKAISALLILAVIIAFRVSAFAFSDGDVMPGRYNATTEKDILFLSIPWMSDIDSALDDTRNDVYYSNEEVTLIPDTSYLGIKYDEVSRNFSDPQGQILPSLISDSVQTKRVVFTNPDSVGGREIGQSLGKVGGYPVGRITMLFVNDSDDIYRLYSGKYSFIESADVDSLTQFMDFQAKLTSLYGEPYTYVYDGREGESDWTFTEYCCVWIGKNNSAVILTYRYYYTGFLAGDDYVYLEYGTTAANSIFDSAIENAAIAEEKARQEAEARRQEIFADNSGL